MRQPVTEQQVLAIYRETIEPLYRFVSVRVDGDRDLAEDITQDTWMRAVRSWRQDGLPERPIAWLTTVARNLLLNHRRRPPHQPLDAAPHENLALPPDDGLPGEAQARAVSMTLALERLPAPQSKLLRAYHLEERRVAEIAEESGISARAVEGRLRRARQSLRRLMQANDAARGGSE
jgi:RNA polymerase sigma-70 factor (ECF subfamily)